ncbi:macro domain-containing protein [Streptomyces sp. NPDC013978]|uniref:macro domain-containing protein n=1 Tax=Streptomyces sp. NPDC013978 TaxID=3364869 RepID=UPI0036FEED45
MPGPRRRGGDIRTLAFCAVSTGVFGYPKEEAGPLAPYTVADWIAAHPADSTA